MYTDGYNWGLLARPAQAGLTKETASRNPCGWPFSLGARGGWHRRGRSSGKAAAYQGAQLRENRERVLTRLRRRHAPRFAEVAVVRGSARKGYRLYFLKVNGILDRLLNRRKGTIHRARRSPENEYSLPKALKITNGPAKADLLRAVAGI
jgi:hypothetical protein